MRRIACLLLVLGTLFVAACGSYAAPVPTRSAIEARQTGVAIAGQPTLAPLNTGPTSTPPAPTPSLEELFQINASDPRALGDPNAPVTLIEFTDFECPFCQQFFRETRAQLIANYVDTGVVRLVARDFPVTDLHPSALVAATAARCAAAQNQFWPMYEQLFSSHQSVWGGDPASDRGTMELFAADLGLDAETFNSCLASPASEQAVRDEMVHAAQLGVNSTPNFLINGQLVRGAQPFSVFQRLIEQKAGQ